MKILSYLSNYYCTKIMPIFWLFDLERKLIYQNTFYEKWLLSTKISKMPFDTEVAKKFLNGI